MCTLISVVKCTIFSKEEIYVLCNFYLAICMGNPSLRLSEVLLRLFSKYQISQSLSMRQVNNFVTGFGIIHDTV